MEFVASMLVVEKEPAQVESSYHCNTNQNDASICASENLLRVDFVHFEQVGYGLLMEFLSSFFTRRVHLDLEFVYFATCLGTSCAANPDENDYDFFVDINYD